MLEYYDYDDFEYDEIDFPEDEPQYDSLRESLAGGVPTDYRTLETRAKIRKITHIMPVKREYPALITEIPMLTMGLRENSVLQYVGLAPYPCARYGNSWVALSESVDARGDSFCFQTDGGSIWYAKYTTPILDSSLTLLAKGPARDDLFAQKIGEDRYRKYFQKRVLTLVEEQYR